MLSLARMCIDSVQLAVAIVLGQWNSVKGTTNSEIGGEERKSKGSYQIYGP